MSMTGTAGNTRGGVIFRHPAAFWLGSAAVTAGVLAYGPMFLGARDDHYVLAGMPWGHWMVIGVLLIGAGLAAVFYGLMPDLSRSTKTGGSAGPLTVLDEGPLRPVHIKLITVLIIAIAIDTLKPFTFTFILPGVADEYGLSSPTNPIDGRWQVALLPLVGIVGTVVGSFVWGYLGDRIGRRASLLLAAMVFIATSICGAMPSFSWNMVMCGVMGLGAGGLLPIAYSLLSETIPARRRGQVVVLVAGIGTAFGFLLTSWLADWLMPYFGWRIMWFVGMPTGLILIVLNRYVPESPRFLYANGRADVADEVMRAFGAVTISPARSTPGTVSGYRATVSYARLFRRPFGGLTWALAVCGLAWGLVDFGFLVWLPINAAASGAGTAEITRVLAKASLFAVPGSFLVAWLYARWSAKYTMVCCAALTAAALAVFAAAGDGVVRNGTALTVLVVVLLIALWAVISVLAPYSAEVYPTEMRAGGAGVCAGASKLGGVVALAMSAAAIAPPGIAASAVLSAVPMLVAAVWLAVVAIETRGRRLEEITSVQVADAEEAAV